MPNRICGSHPREPSRPRPYPLQCGYGNTGGDFSLTSIAIDAWIAPGEVPMRWRDVGGPFAYYPVAGEVIRLAAEAATGAVVIDAVRRRVDVQHRHLLRAFGGEDRALAAARVRAARRAARRTSRARGHRPGCPADAAALWPELRLDQMPTVPPPCERHDAARNGTAPAEEFALTPRRVAVSR